MIQSRTANNWIDDLAGHRIALDSMLFIYHMGGDKTYGPQVAPLFQSMENSRFIGIASVLVLLESMVGPYRSENAGVNDAEQFIRNFPNLELRPVTADLAIHAARIRAAHDLRAPDALHAATAVLSDADALLTNDRAFKRLPDLDILYLYELIKAS